MTFIVKYTRVDDEVRGDAGLGGERPPLDFVYFGGEASSFRKSPEQPRSFLYIEAEKIAMWSSAGVLGALVAGVTAGTVTLSNVKLPVDQNGEKLITGEGE